MEFWVPIVQWRVGEEIGEWQEKHLELIPLTIV